MKSVAAIIIPDCMPVSMALSVARDKAGVLQTNGRRNCIAADLLPGYAQIVGGGLVTLPDEPEPDAA